MFKRVRELGESAKLCLRQMGYWSYVVLAWMVFVAIGNVQTVLQNWTVPLWLWLVLFPIAPVVAVFIVYHQLRIRSASLEAELSALKQASPKRAIETFCRRLDAIAEECDTAGFNMDIQLALTAGAVIKELLDLGAFHDDPVEEGLIRTAFRKQLLVQNTDPKSPAAQGEYQAFWIARRAACKRVGRIGDIEVNPANVKSGCHFIADDARRTWGLEVPTRSQPSSPLQPPVA